MPDPIRESASAIPDVQLLRRMLDDPFFDESAWARAAAIRRCRPRARAVRPVPPTRTYEMEHPMKLPFRRPDPPKPTWIINVLGPSGAAWATFEIAPDDYDLTHGRVVVNAQVIVDPDPVIRQVHRDTP